MVAMTEPYPSAFCNSNSKESEAIDAIEDLISEFGLRAVVTACLQSSAGEQFEQLGGNATLRIAQAIIREVVFAEDPRLEAVVMALGAGILLNDGDNITRLAAKHGMTKQALSKRVVRYVDEKKLPPSTYMRSEKDRKTYALTNQPRTR
jgi:hypothetical protein